MIVKKPIWWDVAIFDDKGLAGISSKATKEQREAYEKHIEYRKKLLKMGIIL